MASRAPAERLATTPASRAAVRTIREAALKMTQTHGLQRTWYALYDIADELVSRAAREGDA